MNDMDISCKLCLKWASIMSDTDPNWEKVINVFQVYEIEDKSVIFYQNLFQTYLESLKILEYQSLILLRNLILS